MRPIDADAIEYKESIIDTVYRSTDDVIVWHEKRTLKWVSKEDIDKMPTIEAEPVRHGHWIFTNRPNIYGGTSIKCSECGYEGMVAHVEDHHYCWFCGAKMDGKGEES